MNQEKVASILQERSIQSTACWLLDLHRSLVLDSVGWCVLHMCSWLVRLLAVRALTPLPAILVALLLVMLLVIVRRWAWIVLRLGDVLDLLYFGGRRAFCLARDTNSASSRSNCCALCVRKLYTYAKVANTPAGTCIVCANSVAILGVSSAITWKLLAVVAREQSCV